MKGYTIDCDYVILVRDYHRQLPRPRKKPLLDIDGTILPLITVEVEV